jgi:hypothetical protein
LEYDRTSPSALSNRGQRRAGSSRARRRLAYSSHLERVSCSAAEARYISIAWSGAARLDRLCADPKEWREFEARHREHYLSTPLESTHIAVRLRSQLLTMR